MASSAAVRVAPAVAGPATTGTDRSASYSRNAARRQSKQPARTSASAAASRSAGVGPGGAADRFGAEAHAPATRHTTRKAPPRRIGTLDPGRVRMVHATFRVRMPRLRQPLRAPDATRPAGILSGVSGRGIAETPVGVRRPVEHPGQVVHARAAGALRQLRRPARARIVLDALRLNRRARRAR